MINILGKSCPYFQKSWTQIVSVYISATEWKLVQAQQDLSWFSLAGRIAAVCRHWDLLCGWWEGGGRVLQGVGGWTCTTTTLSRWRLCSRRQRRPRRRPSRQRGSLEGVDLGQEHRPETTNCIHTFQNLRITYYQSLDAFSRQLLVSEYTFALWRKATAGQQWLKMVAGPATTSGGRLLSRFMRVTEQPNNNYILLWSEKIL